MKGFLKIFAISLCVLVGGFVIAIILHLVSLAVTSLTGHSSLGFIAMLFMMALVAALAIWLIETDRI